MSEFRIGDVARLTGTNSSTLRLWEQHGLIQPARTRKGQRIYTQQDIQRVNAILRLRKIDGLNMSAIRRALEADGQAPGASSPAAAQACATASEGLLGQHFRAARQRLKMSLQQAAAASGLPVSFISTFERTNKGATVAALQKLATCYGTTVTRLSQSSLPVAHGAAEVVRSGRATLAPHFGSGIRIYQLAQSLPSLDCQKWVLQPGARSEGAYSHSGEEFIHVLQGEFHITVGQAAQVTLRQGDSIAFESRQPHSWSAGGPDPTILLWVNTPKSF